MLELLAGRDPWLRIDRRELLRGGTSYTFDTLREIHGELDGADLFFLIGSDSLIDLADWHRAAETVELATFVTVPRDLPGLEFARAQVRARLPDAADRILAHVLDVEPLPISSSQIRSRVRLGLPIDELVPRAVAVYVAQHGLYLDAGASAS
jgi:nicotinate-nucleotide adenylyltransferase